MKFSIKHLVFTVSFILFETNGCYQVAASGWGYGKSNGPEKWCEILPKSDCCSNHQSPINIKHHEATIVHPALELRNYRQAAPTITMTNSGHTISVQLNKLNRLPQLHSKLLQGEYFLDSFHFHWGKTNDRGSEHFFDGKAFPLEMHLVHVNRKYQTSEKAQKHPDGLAVLAVLFELSPGNANPHLSKLFKAIGNVAHSVNEGKLLVNKQRLKMVELLPPGNHIAYHYQGSLTTPPCSQAVAWFVFGKTVKINKRQLSHFRKVFAEDHQVVNNFRPIQSLNGRQVTKCPVNVIS